MTRFDRKLSRRQLLGTGAALAGGLALTPNALRAAPGPIRGVSRAAAQGQQFSGRVVIGTNANPEDPAKQALADAYRAKQPGVEVVWETQDREPEEYVTWLGTQLAAGDINLDIVSGNYVSTFRNYVNLDQYRKTVNPYTGNPWDEDLDWDFFRSLDASGQRNMLATRSVHINWFYNQDLFARAAVAAPPTTWTEFVDVCAKLDAAGITPVGANYDFQVPQWFAEVYFDQYHTHWVETVRAKEGDWNFDPELDGVFVFDATNPNLHNTYTYNQQRFFKGIKDGVLRFDTPEIEAIMTNMAQVFPRYATEDFFVIEDEQKYARFLQGQVAIMATGSWDYGNVTNDLAALGPERLAELGIDAGAVKPFAWSTFENPTMEGELVKSPVRSVESASGEYISIVNKDQAQTNLSVDFAMFWLSAAGYQPYLDGQMAAPEPFSPDGPLEVLGVTEPGEFQELFAQIKMLGNAETNYTGLWSSGAGDRTTQDLRALFQSALEAKITPADYATQLQAYLTTNLDDILTLGSLTQADIDDPARQPGT